MNISTSNSIKDLINSSNSLKIPTIFYTAIETLKLTTISDMLLTYLYRNLNPSFPIANTYNIHSNKMYVFGPQCVQHPPQLRLFYPHERQARPDVGGVLARLRKIDDPQGESDFILSSFSHRITSKSILQISPSQWQCQLQVWLQ